MIPEQLPSRLLINCDLSPDIFFEGRMTLDDEPFTGVAVLGPGKFDGWLLREYIDGMATGYLRRWYLHGQIKEEYPSFSDENSTYREWYESGSLSEFGRLIRGRVVERKRWDESGNVTEHWLGHGVSPEIVDPISLVGLNLTATDMEDWRTVCVGKMLKDGDVITGVIQRFYPDGTISYEAEYLDGVNSGYLRVWYPNGTLFHDHPRFDIENRILRVWHDNGNLCMVTRCHFQTALERKGWDDSGCVDFRWLAENASSEIPDDPKNSWWAVPNEVSCSANFRNSTS